LKYAVEESAACLIKNETLQLYMVNIYWAFDADRVNSNYINELKTNIFVHT
jgi:hypothetical protein